MTNSDNFLDMFKDSFINDASRIDKPQNIFDSSAYVVNGEAHNTQGFFKVFHDRFYEGGTYNGLSPGAFKLLMWLKHYKERFRRAGNDTFYRTDAELSRDSGIAVRTLARYRQELIEKGLIEYFVKHDGDHEFHYKTGHYIVKDL